MSAPQIGQPGQLIELEMKSGSGLQTNWTKPSQVFAVNSAANVNAKAAGESTLHSSIDYVEAGGATPVPASGKQVYFQEIAL